MWKMNEKIIQFYFCRLKSAALLYRDAGVMSLACSHPDFVFPNVALTAVELYHIWTRLLVELKLKHTVDLQNKQGEQ